MVLAQAPISRRPIHPASTAQHLSQRQQQLCSPAAIRKVPTHRKGGRRNLFTRSLIPPPLPRAEEARAASHPSELRGFFEPPPDMRAPAAPPQSISDTQSWEMQVKAQPRRPASKSVSQENSLLAILCHKKLAVRTATGGSARCRLSSAPPEAGKSGSSKREAQLLHHKFIFKQNSLKKQKQCRSELRGMQETISTSEAPPQR